jgi:hypothetical protein
MTGFRELVDTWFGTRLTPLVRELSVQEKQHQAVLAVIAEGFSVVEVASRWDATPSSHEPNRRGFAFLRSVAALRIVA